MDVEKAREELNKALENQLNVGLQGADIARNLYQQQINNANNAAGTLFSSRPIFQGSQYAAKTYIPNVTKLQQNYQQNLIKINDNVQQFLDQIKSYNEAAAKLNGGL